MIPGTLRIHIRTRLIALLLAVNIVPLLAILDDLFKIPIISEGGYQTLEQFQSLMFAQIILFICVGIWIIFLVSSNLTKPLAEIIKVLRSIKNGNFESKVQVTSNDEIGYTGDVINEMTLGLIERDRMQQSLGLAREVQQNLLPKENLIISGFDIAGKSVYCDETGGDYYDFIPIGNGAGNKTGIAIGDVSGHGISSALLMATVRSSLRQRASLPGSSARIITDVNRQLVSDVEDSGQFMTMFFLVLNTDSKQLEWVRAGHDPAIIYDPGSDSFNELSGSGIALGVYGGWNYEEYKKTDLSNGQIIFLSTDGIWEARNKNGEMLGKEPILDTIRQNASSDATQIINAVFGTLEKLIGGVKIEDDITSVVIKTLN
jgi:sigma-B regulation protein RsbU (phosphoserine phosphatase)